MHMSRPHTAGILYTPLPLEGYFRGEYTPPWKPSFFSYSVSEASMVYTLLPDLWCIRYTRFLCFPRKMVNTIAILLLCDPGVGRQTEKGGVPRWWCILLFPLQKSEKLKKAVAVPEEKIQERSEAKAGPIFQQPFSLQENEQTLSGIHFVLAENR